MTDQETQFVPQNQPKGSLVSFNPHPKKASIGDCSRRALVKAAGYEDETAGYKEVKLGLNALRDELGESKYNSMQVLGALMEQAGCPKIWMSTNSYKQNIYTFAASHPDGVYIAETKNHWACVDTGSVYDSYDSRIMRVLGYYRVEDGADIRSVLSEYAAKGKRAAEEKRRAQRTEKDEEIKKSILKILDDGPLAEYEIFRRLGYTGKKTNSRIKGLLKDLAGEGLVAQVDSYGRRYARVAGE